jgi:AcrR family transcriptional regulator
MSGAPQSKKRLDRDSWFQAALAALMEEGIAGVRVERLARTLGVTRGSFYHHFSDRDDLLRDLLEHWIAVSTLAIREEVKALGLDPENTIFALAQMIRHRGGSTFDVAFRAWALHDPMARDYVARADDIRLDYIRSVFEDMGFEGLDAENRARIFLYYEMSEPAVFAQQSEETERALVRKRIDLLTRRDDDGN